ncbi:uncharacterized protein B0H64DRAFT_381026 [Chaetomium fimeti]|uniref:Autophagy protein n=1 Tax=Chaetomium fimeti TaxID=1854472 RepID=A0AAE0HQE5_9PEZI|nr:hypothetical protein B0H64DRAFT_381026 [Chaetomium fimeti]
MGWFDGWFGSDNSGGSDPLRRLDPKLREFLEKESPVKYNNNPPSQPQQQSQPSSPPPPSDQKPTTTTTPTGAPQPPPESLYPDGRYAHLWKTYKPLAAVEAETKSDNEKLSDVLDAFKERKGLIGRAALENCAEEQVDWSACMKSGTWTARMTMCRDEVRRFERCYNAQSRLLKALGYMSAYGRDPQVDEDIQMRADELYHRMLAQEREVERAKEEGREVPAFKTLFEDAPATPAARADAAANGSDVPEPSAAVVASWKTTLEKLPPEEREAEEKALRADHRAKAEMAMKVQGLWQEQAKEREKRKAEGKETFMDRFSALAGSWSGPKST